MAYPLESVNILRHNVIRHPAAVTGRWNPAGFGGVCISGKWRPTRTVPT